MQMREIYELNVLLTFLGTAEKTFHEEKYGQTFKVRDFFFYVPQENFYFMFFHIQGKDKENQ